MSQTLTKILIHIIFSTKKRYPYLNDPAIKKRMHHYLKTTCDNLCCNTIAIGGMEDHIHLLLKLSNTMSLSALVEKIKKNSSKWIKQLDYRDIMLDKFYWQHGYAAFSVSTSNLKIVRQYILDQEIHHKKYSFQDELKIMFHQSGISYDEKYLWN